MPPPARIRAIAVCFVRDGDRLLVERYDVDGETKFYRVIGGGIEFRESAADAVRREWREELGAELDRVRLLGVTENVYTHNGNPGHEIVFVFAGQLRDCERFVSAPVEIVEPDGERHAAEWLSMGELANGPIPLYPPGTLQLFLHADA